MAHVLRTAVLGGLLLSPSMGVVGASTVEVRQSVSGSEWSGGGLTILSDNRLDSEHRDVFAARANANYQLLDNPKNGSAALLVHQRGSYTAAIASCRIL